MKIIDLRSDTITHPTEAMREAMFKAEAGDDVYGEDPTVNLLEAMAAEKMGKESALFTASGTMSNLLAVLTHTRPGNEIILGSEAHMLWYEVGGAAALGGVVMHTVNNDVNGQLSLDDIAMGIRPKNNIHYPETALICLENTHNRCGGAVLTAGYTGDVARLAHSYSVSVHLDGARIFNAAIALGVPVRELTEDVDSISFCLSKGLSAPVGSLLCGSKEFIERARKFRKMIGGGMRQAGVLAAAGIVAMETMIDRLVDDHINAKRLADGLASIYDLKLAQDTVQTNILMFDLSESLDSIQFESKLTARGVKIGNRGGGKFRAVTNRMVDSADIDEAIKIIDDVCRELRNN